jgi:acetylornithine aminotransferase
MKLFDVYSLLPIEPVSARGARLVAKDGQTYLDLYGGHAVISIGHNHPHFVARLKEQLDRISFYSNSVENPLQTELADKLGRISGYPDYQLFLCNSGAEAIENALKIASFATGRNKVIAFARAFHGRTSGAVAATDNPKIIAPFNANHAVQFLPWNDVEAVEKAVDDSVAAVIIEGIQGVGGIHEPAPGFFEAIERACCKAGALLVLDEVQSGYGRTGKFFAHQHSAVKPALITIAKGMGNGFPVGGVLIHPSVRPWSGMLGTTFGGNYLACAAALAVLEVIEQEQLIKQAETTGEYWMQELAGFGELLQVRGRGLMIGFDLPPQHLSLRNKLLAGHRIFTGEAKPNTVRLLPSLALTRAEADELLDALHAELKQPAWL